MKACFSLCKIHEGAIPLPWILDQPLHVITELERLTGEWLDEIRPDEE